MRDRHCPLHCYLSTQHTSQYLVLNILIQVLVETDCLLVFTCHVGFRWLVVFWHPPCPQAFIIKLFKCTEIPEELQ